MIKDILESNETVKPEDERLKKLKDLFPGCFHRDGSFDFDEMKRILTGKVTIDNEGYELNFLGKNYARLLASLDTTTVVVPDEENNKLPENKDSDNIYISGDNIDALKHLLKSYEGQIKCIYIDPPYNTGSDGFVYNDKFNFSEEDLMEKLSIDAVDAERLMEFTKRKSASHSAWLTFIYPRLQLARDLLTDDGVIFISIDDNEQANLKLICDEIFGEENFIASMPRVTKRGGKSSETFAQNHDYLIVYSKSAHPLFYRLKHNDNDFKYKDEFFEDRGFFKLNQTLDYDSLQYSANLDYPIELDGETFYPGSSKELYDERKRGLHDEADWAWRWGQKKFEFGLEHGFIVVKTKKNGSKRIYTKTYQKAYIEEKDDGYEIEYGDRTKSLSTLELTDNKYSNDAAKKDLAVTIGKKTFEYSKPVSLIKLVINLSTKPGDCILDFFSGSGTTAEAIMRSDITDKCNRHFILVQLPEKVQKKTSAYKKGYRTICDIGMDRIRKVGDILREAHPDTKADLGFRHYTLQEPDPEVVDLIENFTIESDADLFATDNIYKKFGKDTILATWLVRDGYHFAKASEVEEVDLHGYTGYFIGKHLYLIEPQMPEEAVMALMDRYGTDPHFRPTHVVVFGYNFTWTELENLKNNLTHFRDTEDNLRISLDIRY